MLTEKAALHHEDRHLVSNVIGADDSHIDMGLPRRLDKQDTLLIGSDGLFDNLRLDEIVQLIRKGPLAEAAATLGALVEQRMTATSDDGHPNKPDDLAFILFRQHPPSRSSASNVAHLPSGPTMKPRLLTIASIAPSECWPLSAVDRVQ